MYCYTVPQGPWCCNSRILWGSSCTTLDLTWPWPLYNLFLITLWTVCTVVQYHRGHGVVTVESRGARLARPLTLHSLDPYIQFMPYYLVDSMYCCTVPQGPWCCHSRIPRGTSYTTLDLYITLTPIQFMPYYLVDSMYCYTVPQGPWYCHSRIPRGTAYTTLDLTWPWPLYTVYALLPCGQ